MRRFTCALGMVIVIAACAASQQVINSIPPAAACVVDIVTAIEGSVNVADIIRECGVTAQDIFAIVSELLNAQPDASAVVEGGAGASFTSAQVAHLKVILQNADAARHSAAK